MSNMIFWNAKAPGSVGQMAYLVDGIYRNVASAEGLTLEQLNADGGAYELIPSHEVWERLTNGYVAPVKEIDAERLRHAGDPAAAGLAHWGLLPVIQNGRNAVRQRNQHLC